MPQEPVTYKDFAAKIKAKYPEYKDADDKILAEKMIAKYPEYEDKITFESVEGDPTNFTEGSSEPVEQPTTTPSEASSGQSEEGGKTPHDIRTSNVQLEGQDSPSTVLMTSAGWDGKEVAYPTLFPKDPNNQTDNPEDWIQLEGEAAYKEAQKRGEVWEFDSAEEADKFAKGSWKKGGETGEIPQYSIEDKSAAQLEQEQAYKEQESIGAFMREEQEKFPEIATREVVDSDSFTKEAENYIESEKNKLSDIEEEFKKLSGEHSVAEPTQLPPPYDVEGYVKDLDKQYKDANRNIIATTAAIISEKEKKGSAMGALRNSIINGYTSSLEGLTEMTFAAMAAIDPAMAGAETREEALKNAREAAKAMGTKEVLDLALKDANTSEEYMDKLRRKSLVHQGILGAAESIFPMTTPAMSGFFAQAYNGALEEVKDNENLNEVEKAGYASVNAAFNMALERFGLSKVMKGTPALTKKVAQKLTNKVLKEAGEDATEETIQKAVKNEMSAFMKGLETGGERFLNGFLVEAETGGLQEGTEMVEKALVNAYKDKQVFEDLPKDLDEAGSQIIKAAIAEGVGGPFLGSVSIVSAALRAGEANVVTNLTDQQFRDLAAKLKDPEALQALKENLQAQVNLDPSKKENAEATLKAVEEIRGVMESIPADTPNKKQVADLMLRKARIEKEAEDAPDKTLYNKKISKLNKEIDELIEPTEDGRETKETQEGTVRDKPKKESKDQAKAESTGSKEASEGKSTIDGEAQEETAVQDTEGKQKDDANVKAEVKPKPKRVVPPKQKTHKFATPQERTVNREVKRVDEKGVPQEGKQTVLEEEDGSLVLQEYNEDGSKGLAQELSTKDVNEFELVETVKDDNGSVIGAVVQNKEGNETFAIMDEEIAMDFAIEKTTAEKGEFVYATKEGKKQQDSKQQYKKAEEGRKAPEASSSDSDVKSETKKEKPSEEAKKVASDYGYKAPQEAVNRVNKRLYGGEKRYTKVEQIPTEELVEAQASKAEQVLRESISETISEPRKTKEKINNYIDALKKGGKISSFQAGRLLKRMNNVTLTSQKQVEGFLEDVKKQFDKANIKAKQKEAARKVKKVKASKGKSTLGQQAKTFSKVNPAKITDPYLLDEVIEVADDLLSKSPLSTASTITGIVKKAQEAIPPKGTKSIEDRIKNNLKKREDAATATQVIGAEIERQELISEYIASEEDVDPDLLAELDEDLDAPLPTKDVTSMKVAAQANGDITRARNKIKKAVEAGSLTQEQAKELEQGLKTAVEKYNKDLDKIKQQVTKEFKVNRREVEDAPLEGVEKHEADLLVDTPMMDDVAWISRANDAFKSILAGNIPYKEITDLREYQAFKSKAAEELSSEIKKINPKGYSLAAWIKKLGTKEAAQRARNILKSRDGFIWKHVYQPMSNTLSKASKLSNKMASEYMKEAKPSAWRPSALNRAYRKSVDKAGMMAQYMREASLDPNQKADGVAVGNRDIFGIWLGNKAAMDAAGMDAKTQRQFADGQGMDNYTPQEQKMIKEIHAELVNTKEGYVDVSKLKPEEVLSGKALKIFNAGMKTLSQGKDMQEASNLRRGKEFTPQTVYVPTWRIGGSKDADSILSKATAWFEKFSASSKSGKEKLTESLRPTVGVYPIDMNGMVLQYTDEVAIDYTFSEYQPVKNAILNSAIAQTDGNVIARAVKGDYNASLDYERARGNTNPLLTKLLGARYAKSLFDPIRSAIEVVAAFTSIPFKVRSGRGIIDTFDKKSWNVLKKLEEQTGAKIADFKSADIERQSIKEGKAQEGILLKSGRQTMGAPEYFTAVTGFMPLFRREFMKQAGEPFDAATFLSDPDYSKVFSEEIKSAAAVGQEMIERIYGPKTKGGSRRFVEVAPPKLLGISITKDKAPVTVKADSNEGRLISFFGNFGYREQGEFFNSLKFIAEDLAKGKANTEDMANATGVLMNAVTYSYLMAMYYFGKQILLGDDEEKEQAYEDIEALHTPSGLLKTITNQIAFLGVSKYGKVSRGFAIVSLSELYYMADDKKVKQEIKEVLQDNFYLREPLPIKSSYGLKKYVADEMLPAVTYVASLATGGERALLDFKDDPEAIVAMDLALNIINLQLAISAGTQLPMSPQLKALIKKQRRGKTKHRTTIDLDDIEVEID